VAGWALATGTWAGALMAWAAVDQSTERVLPGRLAQAASGALAAASVVALVGVAAGWWPPPATTGSGWLPWALAAIGVLAAVALGVVAHRRLELLRRSRVTSGGSLVSGMQGAMFALDLGLVRDILVDREAVARGHVRPTRGRWVGARALVWRDLQRLVRYPKPLVGLVAAALVPYVTDPLGLGLLDPLVAALVLMAALIPFLGSLRVLSRTRGLARTFPLATSAIRSATMTVPAVLALVWAVAVVPATAGLTGGVARPPVDAALVALSSAAAGLLGAVRWQTAQPVDFGVPMLATGAGALPPTLVFNLVRGVDIVALVTAPLLLGASPWWSLGIAGGVFLLLRQGFNMAEMAEEAKEQQRLVETEKARASQARVRVPRPGR